MRIVWKRDGYKDSVNLPKEEKHFRWRGNAVGYRALHYWVASRLGKACQCEFCGKVKNTPRSIHWANKSGEYLRELTDWISLCVSCHALYDGNRGRRSLIKTY